MYSDVITPADTNAIQNEAEKKLEYKSVCTETKRMWNVKCTIIPVVTGDTGIVTKCLKKCGSPYQENIQ